jgi:hypothetical protein
MVNALGSNDYMLGFGTHCHFSDFSGLILWFTLRDHPLRSIERK